MNPLKNKIFCGGNLEVVSSWPSNFISAIVTDPPYGIGFMGKDWDTFSLNSIDERMRQDNKRPAVGIMRTHRSNAAGSYDFSRNAQFQQWFTAWAKTMLRITKPGGFLLCFGGTRTYHRLACAIEDAGWEIRDCMMWLYGSGFPKSHNISKAIDKIAGATRKITKIRTNGNKGGGAKTYDDDNYVWDKPFTETAPATSLAEVWDGYGTALKPAWEPIIVAMKPLDGTFAHNAEAHGVAGLNIDAARIGTEKRFSTPAKAKKDTFNCSPGSGITYQGQEVQGRWPANLILDEEAAAMLDEQTGITTSKRADKGKGIDGDTFRNPSGDLHGIRGHNDSGGASRFFYCAKTSRKERNVGLDDQSGEKVNDGRDTPIDNPYQRGETIRKNIHPTVKPLALMKYLCTLLKMPGSDQIILDPFLGSGTTGIACKELSINFIGIEKEREYCEIAVKRIAAVSGQEITLETSLPVTKNMETVRTTKDSAGGKCHRPNESLPHVSESRQRIIDAASTALRKNQK
jgi:site-specific DNA-methyltransferase (adenine-specific)